MKKTDHISNRRFASPTRIHSLLVLSILAPSHESTAITDSAMHTAPAPGIDLPAFCVRHGVVTSYRFDIKVGVNYSWRARLADGRKTQYACAISETRAIVKLFSILYGISAKFLSPRNKRPEWMARTNLSRDQRRADSELAAVALLADHLAGFTFTESPC